MESRAELVGGIEQLTFSNLLYCSPNGACDDVGCTTSFACKRILAMVRAMDVHVIVALETNNYYWWIIGEVFYYWHCEATPCLLLY